MQLYIEAHPGSNLCYTLVFGKDLVIDPSTRQVFLKGKELNFTRKEFDLLFCLASNAGRVISREQLYEQVWSEDTAHDVDGLVKTHSRVEKTHSLCYNRLNSHTTSVLYAVDHLSPLIRF